MKKIFTLNYDQPSDYQFSLDSIQLAEKIIELYKNRQDLNQLRCLDLCCGCGVIGLEIYFFLQAITHFDFVDIEESYRPYFEKNCEKFSPPPNFNFYQKNYLFHEGQYDLIVCNPPYFFSNEGILSPSSFKNRCRFFLDASFKELIESIARLLAPSGEAYILINKGEAYGKNRIEEAKTYLESNFKLESLGKIRITELVKVSRNS